MTKQKYFKPKEHIILSEVANTPHYLREYFWNEEREKWKKELENIYKACDDYRVWEIQVRIGGLLKRLDKERR